MAPIVGVDHNDDVTSGSSEVSLATVIYVSVFFTILIMSFALMCMKMSFLGQKTRNPQQRRGGMYVGSRARTSLGPHEPTVYVSPSNLPPPPKYECMAPPSYEEVVGVHYPNYQVQPITQPIATAMAQNTQPTTTAQANDTGTARNNETVVVTVNERPTVTSS